MKKARGGWDYRIARTVAFSIVAAFFTTVVGLEAQQTTGRILGTVLDQSGSAIPNAQISVRDQNTGTVRNAVSGSDGVYAVPQVPAGTYTIEAMAAGFSLVQVKDVIVIVSSDTRVDLKMPVGSVSQTVTVSEAASLVDTTNSSVGSTVNEQRVEDLPLNGRNFTDLTEMQAGISRTFTTGVGANGTPNTVGLNGNIYISNGATIHSNFYSLDGANMLTVIDANNTSIIGTSLGVDGIKEFKVLTSSVDAQYPLVAGSQTTIVSRGGTNEFHGDAYNYLRNSSLDSRNFFDALDTKNVNGFGSDKSLTYPGKRIPPFRRNDFGGSFGGPIKKDKTFFFGVFEGIRQKLGLTVTSVTLPKPCFVNQSGVLQAQVPAQIMNVNSFGTCVSGGPATINVNPLTLPFADEYPVPNSSGYPTFNYTFPFTAPESEEYGQMRVDHNFSDKDLLFGRYTADFADSMAATGGLGVGGSVAAFQGFSISTHSTSQFATVAETHIFSPTLLNTARVSFSRTWGKDLPIQGPGEFELSRVLVAGSNLIGTVSPGNGVTGIGPFTFNPVFGAQDVWTWSDDVFWTKNKHGFKFGTLINRYRKYYNDNFNSQGSLGFASIANFFNGINYSSFSSNIPNNFTYRDFHQSTFGFYAQDDYRVLPRVTANLGLRYEFTTVPVENNPALRFDIRNPLTDAAGTPGNMFLNNSLHDFSPRVGLAWDVTGKGTTSVKAGAGIYYDVGGFGPFILSNSIAAPPVSSGISISNALATPVIPLTVPFTVVLPKISPRTEAYHMQQPTFAEYNLTVQQQLPWGLVLSVAYVGSRGWHQYQVREGNPTIDVGTTTLNGIQGIPIYGCWNAAQTSHVLPGGNGACPAGFTNFGPKTNPHWNTEYLSLAKGDSHYNSLQTQLLKRLSNGLQFQFAYTYSRLISDGISVETLGAPNNQIQLANGFPERFDRGVAGWDVTNNVRANVIYFAPKFKSENVLGKLSNGWWFSTIVSAQGGYPVTPLLGSDRELQNDVNTFEHPDLAPSFNKATLVEGTPTQWFNPTMFALQPAGTIGTMGAGILRGPGLFNVDFSVVKDTKVGLLGEAGNIEFRAEFFNLLNHANFANPNATVWTSGTPGAVAAGQIGSAGIPAFASAGQITSTVTTSRQIQLALKLIF